MRDWIWRQLHISLPDDWELLQFSRNPQTGRCAFADRYRFRFELNWRIVEGTPDFDRMLSDYRARLEEDGLTDTQRRQCAGWQGVCGTMKDGRATTRYGGFFDRQHCLVEAVFLWPKRRNPPIEEEILSSLRPEPITPKGQARWLALGMDALTGSQFHFEHCTADPGHALFSFTAEHRRLWDHFSRRGMVRHWLHEPVPDWQRKSVPKGFSIVRNRNVDIHGHSVHRLEAVKTHPVLPDWLFGRREFHCASWLCPRDGRLYHLSRQAPRRRGNAPRRPPPVLRCCSDVEVSL